MFFFVTPPVLRLVPEFADHLVARFIFKPERAPEFVDQDGQLIVESLWDDAQELVKFCKEIEDALVGCVVLVNGTMITLSEMTSR